MIQNQYSVGSTPSLDIQTMQTIDKNIAVVAKRQTPQTQILASFTALGGSSPLNRIPDLDLVQDVISFSQDSPFVFDIINLLTIYKLLLESMQDLNFARKKKCNVALNEIEASFRNFLDTGVLLPRKAGVSYVFG